jgi:thioredoxin reductase (NADPH)
MAQHIKAEVIIVGGGLAGLSAAVYLGRSTRDVLLIDSGKSMARAEPKVENYLGFPDAIDGKELLRRSAIQAQRYGARLKHDEVLSARLTLRGTFRLRSRKAIYHCKRLLLATGIFHVPPSIPGIRGCVGRGLYFCRDCDGYRVRGRDLAIYGWTNEAAEYALGMLSYSPRVAIVTDGHKPHWDRQYQRWIREYKIPVFLERVARAKLRQGHLRELVFKDGKRISLDALFTTRGDVYYNKIAKNLGAKIKDGEIVVDLEMRTSIPGLFAAGCVTPANCQMIIAAGQGATAAQAINHDLFCESLARVRKSEVGGQR